MFVFQYLKKIIFLFPFFLMACTTVGVHDNHALNNVDFKETTTIRLCVFKEETISEEKASLIFKDAVDELKDYKINLNVILKQYPFLRTSFLSDGILSDFISNHPLKEGCDRNYALVDRNFSDYVYGAVIGVEVLGEVDNASHSFGYSIATIGSINQLFKSPSEITTHEIYHLLGCPHSLSLKDCYKNISELKSGAIKNLENGVDFFPSMSFSGNTLWSRDTVNQEAINAVNYFRNKDKDKINVMIN